MAANVLAESETPVMGVTSGGIPSRMTAYVGIGLSVVFAVCILFVDLDRIVDGLLTIGLMLSLMLLGVHIGVAMAGAGAVGLYAIGGFKVVNATFGEAVFNSVSTWSLSVIPLFILMGIVMWKGRLTDGAYSSARLWMGRLPGGLAVATNFAGAGLAASSGSTIGISMALGKIAIPEMLRAGYRPSLAAGTVAMAGTLGQLIPPSVMLVIYAGIAQTPVGPQLMAAIVPGIIVALGYGLMIVVRAAINPSLAPRVDLSGVTMKDKVRSLTAAVPVAVIVLVVIGGIFGGIFTATEAGAFGAFAAFVLAWIHAGKGNRGLRKQARFVLECVKTTAISSAAIFFLLIGVHILTRVVALSQLAQQLSRIVTDLGLSRITFLFVLVALYVVLGMFLDPLAMLLLTIPVLAAPLSTLGVDMIFFGVFAVLLAEVAIVSPPVGVLSFIVHRLAQDPAVNLGRRVSLTDVFKGVLPFIAITLAFLVLFIYFPEIALWLPGISSAG